MWIPRLLLLHHNASSLPAAGVGDALATYFEARACYQADGLNLVNQRPSRTGLGLAQLCFEILSENIDKSNGCCAP